MPLTKPTYINPIDLTLIKGHKFMEIPTFLLLKSQG